MAKRKARQSAKSNSRPKTRASARPGQVRINKFIADCGVASRRKADEMILEGLVTINGRKVTEPGVQVRPGQDAVKVKGKLLNADVRGDFVYYAFHKPLQVMSTMKDPEGRPTLNDYFKRSKKRIFPVGRLDWDSEGLILMTNDGDFSQKVSHPQKEIPKTYLVKLDGQPTEAQLEKLKKGVSIIGGRVKAKEVYKIKKGRDKYAWCKIVITEGKNRQVRRMFEKIGFDVKKLQRVSIGKLSLGRLAKGKSKLLSPNDIKKIFS